MTSAQSLRKCWWPSSVCIARVNVGARLARIKRAGSYGQDGAYQNGTVNHDLDGQDDRALSALALALCDVKVANPSMTMPCDAAI